MESFRGNGGAHARNQTTHIADCQYVTRVSLYESVTTTRCAPYYVLRRSMEHPCWQSRLQCSKDSTDTQCAPRRHTNKKHFFCGISHFQKIRYRYWTIFMITTILNLKRMPYHEVRVMIIISSPRNCRNSASQIKEPHATTIARRGYKNRAPQLSELHATLI